MVIVAPSILSADFANLAQDISMAEKAGADWLHIDVMDGHFVNNITIGPLIVAAIKPYTKLFLDVHLMIEHPEKYIEQFAAAGADLLCVHLETLKNPHTTIQAIKKLNKKVGLAINPDKKFSYVQNYLPEIDMALFMSVFPGFAGQKFIPDILPEIKKCREFITQNNFNIDIEIDGGINRETVQPAISAGANIIVAGSAIFKAADPKKEISFYKAL